jgi:hypothetical protein
VCIIFRHDDFPNIELYCHHRWCHVEEEGPEACLFDAVATIETGEEELQQLPTEVDPTTPSAEDVNNLLAEGFAVDDDNHPAPENIPTANDTTTTGTQQTWGWSGFCSRRAASIPNLPAAMNNLVESDLKSMTYLSVFLWFFPTEFLHNVLLK